VGLFSAVCALSQRYGQRSTWRRPPTFNTAWRRLRYPLHLTHAFLSPQLWSPSQGTRSIASRGHRRYVCRQRAEHRTAAASFFRPRPLPRFLRKQHRYRLSPATSRSRALRGRPCSRGNHSHLQQRRSRSPTVTLNSAIPVTRTATLLNASNCTAAHRRTLNFYDLVHIQRHARCSAKLPASIFTSDGSLVMRLLVVFPGPFPMARPTPRLLPGSAAWSRL